MTRTGSCFVIKEYRKASYKKVVEKKNAIVSYSERSSVNEKVSDFPSLVLLSLSFLGRLSYSHFEFLSDQAVQLDISD
jgi:hypothetical protein